MMQRLLSSVFVLALVLPGTAQQGDPPAPTPAQPGATEPAPPREQAPPKDPDGLAYETGKVKVGSYATMALGEGWRYLQAAGARRVVEKVWHNPPRPAVIGLVFPPDAGPREGYAIVVSYESDGYVKDDDAAGLDYADLLKTMQEDTRAANEPRKKAGYETIELLGWAEPPRYDAKEKKLYWAKKLMFGGSDQAQLNYDVRILGRGGYLVLTAVAAAAVLPAVASACKEILGVTEFVDGQRYTDFSPSYDKVAVYGIGGLIAGKLLLKVGLFKGILALWKPIAVGFVALLGVIGKLLGRRKPANAAGPSQRSKPE